MVIILHGDDLASSRKRYIEAKQESKHPIILEGSSFSLADVNQALSTELLFSDSKDIFIENFFSKRKLIAKETKEIIAFIQKNSAEHQIVFWESKKMTPAALKSFPQAKIELFSIPQVLFKFIDYISPNNGKRLVELFHQTLEQTEPELIFFLMVKQIRILLSISLGSSTEEMKTIAPWQFQNLQRQISNFSSDQLTQAYKKLFQIDLTQKTGRTSLSLIQNIDIFLLGL